MLARVALFIVLLLPGVAWAQFSLAVTQIDNDTREDIPTYQGVCAADACRATMPVRVGGDLCIMNVNLAAPDASLAGRVLFSVGPCRSGVKLSNYPVSAGYFLDRLGATSQTVRMLFQPANWTPGTDDLNDAVVHETATLRLDIIATKVR